MENKRNYRHQTKNRHFLYCCFCQENGGTLWGLCIFRKWSKGRWVLLLSSSFSIEMTWILHKYSGNSIAQRSWFSGFWLTTRRHTFQLNGKLWRVAEAVETAVRTWELQWLLPQLVPLLPPFLGPGKTRSRVWRRKKRTRMISTLAQAVSAEVVAGWADSEDGRGWLGRGRSGRAGGYGILWGGCRRGGYPGWCRRLLYHRDRLDTGGLCPLKVFNMNSESKAGNKGTPPETIWMRHEDRVE